MLPPEKNIVLKKITDPKYFLPVVFAMEENGTLNTGTTKPVLIRGICKQNKEKGDYVVKFKHYGRMTPMSSSFELIAALIAMELGLNVAEPAIIEISEAFVETLEGTDNHQKAKVSIGYNFGCKYQEGYWEPMTNQGLSLKEEEQAQEIFPFDILILNVDRRVEKPNLITNGERFLIFDHELAFGFVREIIKNASPWIINEMDYTWIRTHYFYQHLKQHKHNFDTFVDKFDALNENFWKILKHLIPEEWIGDHFYAIKNYLCTIVKEKELFKQELKKIFS